MSALCDVIASLARHTNSDLILDLGCGKGALGSLISLNHGLHVMGIDAVGFQAHVEEVRQAKLEKTFKSELKKRRPTENVNPDDQPAAAALKFHRTTQFVSRDLNCDSVVEQCQDHFQHRFSHRLGLVGLHTCGNLASTSVELFVNSPKVLFLCNVGCCYHLIDEAFEKGPLTSEPGFPISGVLKSKRFTLGRNARMVAAQPLERSASENRVTSSFDSNTNEIYVHIPVVLENPVAARFSLLSGRTSSHPQSEAKLFRRSRLSRGEIAQTSTEFRSICSLGSEEIEVRP